METYKHLLGVKYKAGGRTVEEGMDCYGVAIEVYREEGKYLADKLSDPKEFLEHLEPLSNPEIKSLIAFYNKQDVCYHIAVYLGNGVMIHSRDKYGVCIEPLRRFPSARKEYYRVY